MRLLVVLSVLCLVCCVRCKTNSLKSLTESMGQEVIEIGAPIKGLNELPADLDEEPSAEEDDDDTTTTTTTTTFTPATNTKKASPITEARRRGSKDIDKIDDREDEDARIEKELAEIYKDNLDYKAETPEVTTTTTQKKTTAVDSDKLVFKTVADTVAVKEKPIARSKTNFKFQPDSDNKAEIERWRTSIDDITCDKASTSRLNLDTEKKTSSTSRITMNILVLLASSYILSTCG